MEAEDSSEDFFISYTASDVSWAEWVAWELEKVGYSTVIQVWDFRAGQDWAHEMQRSAQSAKRTIAILSPDYLGSRFGEAEWRIAFAKDPTGEAGLLVPVRIAEMEPPGLLRTRLYIDLVGLDEESASKKLLNGVQGELRAKPSRQPGYPSTAARPNSRPTDNPRYPGEVDASGLKVRLQRLIRYSRTYEVRTPTNKHTLSVTALSSWITITLDGERVINRLIYDIEKLVNLPKSITGEYKGRYRVLVADAETSQTLWVETECNHWGIQRIRISEGGLPLHDE